MYKPKTSASYAPHSFHHLTQKRHSSLGDLRAHLSFSRQANTHEVFGLLCVGLVVFLLLAGKGALFIAPWPPVSVSWWLVPVWPFCAGVACGVCCCLFVGLPLVRGFGLAWLVCVLG